MSRRLTRRAALAAAGAAGAATAGALALRGGRDGDGPARPTVAAVPGLPAAQHAWDAVLRRDEHGNPLLPRHHRILLLDLARRPDRAGRARLEDALRRLERRHPCRPDGLLTLLAWGPAYFAAIGRPSPVPEPTALTPDEAPEPETAACCLVLASDDEARLAAAERALVGDAGRDRDAGDRDAGGDGAREGAGGDNGALAGVLRLRARRTGFAGAGLPARAQHAGLAGTPRPIARDAPLFMGFKSGLRRNQATEEDVTIPSGPLAGGTTLHLSTLALELDSWYELSERDRVARMYAPQVTPAQAARFTDDAPAPAERLERTAARYGRVGHVQALATVRRDGRPRILRRDVNTVDDGGPGLYFLSLQRSIDDFVATRQAMSAARSRAAPGLDGVLNNGINEWMRVTRRGNFAVPPRHDRAFPLLEAAGDA